MSIGRIAVRIAAVEALRDRTLVGDNVVDSQIGAIDVGPDGVPRIDQQKPFIAVYTDGSVAESGLARDLHQNGRTELLFEMGVTAAMGVTNDQGETTIVGMPATDRSFEFMLDILSRQITDALLSADNEWAAIFLGLIDRIVRIERSRTGNIADGVRLAGQQIKLTVDLADDPVRGAGGGEGSPFANLLALMAARPDYQQEAAMLAAELAGTFAEWEIARRRHGMTPAEMPAYGLGPLGEYATGDAPALESAEFEVPQSCLTVAVP